ncbi:hypothetical protein LOTGIDRAFT_141007 [Lottia gigantea]|uniref:Rab-GAP TBC domain-containing protein n=1 Tax=Lottia gigantea TaxID=225164 RepID=V4ASL7_LOTGI|nr:hypothetical protein LOTGIDRAFT_141007 [Lottia gigantea]ESP00273.1 hypothetical protein LOTGIDRAFT_141007 [Lottia gigantea]
METSNDDILPPSTPPTSRPSYTSTPNPSKPQKVNNNDEEAPPKAKNGKMPTEEELLAKLEAANRMLEEDEKSFNSLSAVPVTPGHSRKGSGSSVISSTSTNSHYSNSNETLWDVWGRLVNDWDTVRKRTGYLKELVRKGIPSHFRGLAWQYLLNVHDSPSKHLYVEYLKKTSPFEKLIRRDIARTFPDHEFFKEKDGLGQESLFNVMKAYSLHDREVGYCQGSGFIVGLLLMQMPEEETFAVLVKIMVDYRLRELFKPSMAELGLCMFKLECLIQELLPELYVHFNAQNFYTSMYASSWFLTLYTTSFPLAIACRIMDLFISEGMDAIFRLAIAILQSSQEDLLSLDMEGMLRYFQKDLRTKYESDPEQLLQISYQVKYSQKKLKKLEKEYTALKSKENEEQIELRRLRTENNLLRQRIECLEKESASLADRLIQDQVNRAQEAEITYALKNELAMTKQKLCDLTKKYEEADVLICEVKERTSSYENACNLTEDAATTLIQQLQEELIAVRLRETETNTLIKELKLKISELEDRAPSNDIQQLQEELIAVKLREAEANLSLKELRQRVIELESYWESHMERMQSLNSPKEKSSKQEVRQLQEETMTIKLREAQTLVNLKEMKQKVMELETQNQICTNQMRRMGDENKSIKTEMEAVAEHEKDLNNTIKDLKRKIDDLESQKREESMMFRIREAEKDQMLGSLKQTIASLEIEKAELLTTGQLLNKEGNQDLTNKIYDLQEEVGQFPKLLGL